MSLDDSVRSHLADSYPHNHDYRVQGRTLLPCRKLERRWRRIRQLWPSSFDSFLDVGCSKGFFVLEAARLGADALGIDIHEQDLAACSAVRDHLELSGARFEHKTLEQLSSEPLSFDLVHVVNTYHYLFFGSDRAPARATDHQTLFEHLAHLTSGVLLFSNCETFERCPESVRAAASPERAAAYTPGAIRKAASRWFEIEDHGLLGKRPFWVGRRRETAAS
jgi:SAM-dependent methyltransferase